MSPHRTNLTHFHGLCASHTQNHVWRDSPQGVINHVASGRADLNPPPLASPVTGAITAMEGKTMQSKDVPRYLRQAREEVILALSAPNAEEECGHRRRAGQFMSEVVRTVHSAPALDCDWSLLRAPE